MLACIKYEMMQDYLEGLKNESPEEYANNRLEQFDQVTCIACNGEGYIKNPTWITELLRLPIGKCTNCSGTGTISRKSIANRAKEYVEKRK